MEKYTTCTCSVSIRQTTVYAEISKGSTLSMLFSEFISSWNQFDGHLQVSFYSPNENHYNNFICVLNNNKASKYTDSIKWNEVMAQTKTDALGCKKQQSKQHRQKNGNFHNYGYCPGHSTSRINNSSGIAKPNMKKNTNSSAIVECFVSLSIAANTETCSLRDEKYEDILPPTYLHEFSKMIHPDNVFTSLHPSITNINQQCGCHHNRVSNSRILQEVFCISILKNGQQLSVNGQQRKSIDDYCNRVVKTKHVFSEIKNVIHNMHPSRVDISHSLFDGTLNNWIEHFPTIKNNCNISAMGFSETVVDGVSRLSQYYNLTLPEAYSCQRAYEFVPNTTLFFGVAVEMLLSIKKKELPAIFCEKYAIGWLIAKINEHLLYSN